MERLFYALLKMAIATLIEIFIGLVKTILVALLAFTVGFTVFSIYSNLKGHNEHQVSYP